MSDGKIYTVTKKYKKVKVDSDALNRCHLCCFHYSEDCGELEIDGKLSPVLICGNEFYFEDEE